MAVSALLDGDSPRLQGHDEAHVARLAEADDPLPPIIVNRDTMRVIDGAHRLLAARLKAQTTIDVLFFDGSSADAFLVAVRANVAHGLPLSLTDRKAAAKRIIRSHPQMSDRMIAQISGLGATTVGNLRHGLEGSRPTSPLRVGKDGRVRPLDNSNGRLRAIQFLTKRPDAPLREVARSAGISLSTAHDVRKRLKQSSIPLQTASTSSGDQVETDCLTRQSARSAGLQHLEHSTSGPTKPAAIAAKLQQDPSLRHKDKGRHLLRLINHNNLALDDWMELASAVPAHCGLMVSELAQHYALMWKQFAESLEGGHRAA